MALHGSQKKFDKNGDGKLSSREWQNWYLRTYGVDIENAERRKRAQNQANWDAWLSEAVSITHTAAEGFLDAACELLESTQPETRTLAWQALLCQLTAALTEGNQWNSHEKTDAGMFVSGQIFYHYRAAAYDLARMSRLCSEKELEEAVLKRRPLFLKEGCLTQEDCGNFWQAIIAKLPPYYDEEEPEFKDGYLRLNLAPDTSYDIEKSLRKLLENLFPLVSFFAGAAEKAADQRNNRLLVYFTVHWEALQGKYIDPPSFSDAVVGRLVEKFPQLYKYWSLEQLEDILSGELFNELYRADPEFAISVWQSIPDTTAPLADPKAAEDFMYAFELIWFDSEASPELLCPVLDALHDEAFARQVFLSAFVEYFHWHIIRAAYVCSGQSFAKHLWNLLMKNPLPHDRWKSGYEDMLEFLDEHNVPWKTWDREPAIAPHDDDTTVYRYCTVRIPNLRRTYAYLTNGLDLKVGDQVYAPLGHMDAPVLGTVISVENHSRSTAPYPPEKTKKLLRKSNTQDT